MTNPKPTKKDFVDLINSVMGQEVMTEEQLSNFLNSAKQARDTQGDAGLLDYIQKVTNAPIGRDQLGQLAKQIKETGNPMQALDFLQKENLVSESQARKINQAVDRSTKKKRKK